MTTKTARTESKVITREEHAQNRADWMSTQGLPPSTRTPQQYKAFSEGRFNQDGQTLRVSVCIRWDGNGVNSFSITGTVYSRRGEESGGCIHEEIAKAYPQYAHLIKWHGMMADGPMHYVGNTLYHAGDRDHHGKRAGEPWAFDDCVRFGKNPIAHKLDKSFVHFICEHAPQFDFEVLAIEHDDRGKQGKYQFAPKFTFGGYGTRWGYCPFDSEGEALAFLHALQHCEPVFDKIPTQWSEGKKRELDHARSTAVWPEATDAQLIAMADNKEAGANTLLARLPELMQTFKRDIEALGFTY